jgi:hypothetical protein
VAGQGVGCLYENREGSPRSFGEPTANPTIPTNSALTGSWEPLFFEGAKVLS